MHKGRDIKLFLVDDDTVYLKSLEIEFLHRPGYIIETFTTGELCLNSIGSNPDIVILDYFLNATIATAMNGIETLDKIKAFSPNIHVVMLSAQDKIDVAIDCMHHQASDYIVKSETAFIHLHKVISRLVSYQKLQNQLSWYMDRA